MALGFVVVLSRGPQECAIRGGSFSGETPELVLVARAPHQGSIITEKARLLPNFSPTMPRSCTCLFTWPTTASTPAAPASPPAFVEPDGAVFASSHYAGYVEAMVEATIQVSLLPRRTKQAPCSEIRGSQNRDRRRRRRDLLRRKLAHRVMVLAEAMMLVTMMMSAWARWINMIWV